MIGNHRRGPWNILLWRTKVPRCKGKYCSDQLEVAVACCCMYNSIPRPMHSLCLALVKFYICIDIINDSIDSDFLTKIVLSSTFNVLSFNHKHNEVVVIIIMRRNEINPMNRQYTLTSYMKIWQDWIAPMAFLIPFTQRLAVEYEYSSVI